MAVGTTKGVILQNKRARESRLLSDIGCVYAVCEPLPTGSQKGHRVNLRQDLFCSILAIFVGI